MSLNLDPVVLLGFKGTFQATHTPATHSAVKAKGEAQKAPGEPEVVYVPFASVIFRSTMILPGLMGPSSSTKLYQGEEMLTSRPRRLTAGVLVAGCACAMLLVGASASFAQGNYTPATSPTVSSTTPAPGASTTISGNGYAANSSFQVVIFSSPVVLGTGTTDATGTATSNVTIPASFQAGSTHTLQLQGTDPTGASRILSQQITLAGGTVGVAATASTGGLAYTGVPVGVYAGGAGVLLVAGTGLVLVGRRRKTLSN